MAGTPLILVTKPRLKKRLCQPVTGLVLINGCSVMMGSLRSFHQLWLVGWLEYHVRSGNLIFASRPLITGFIIYFGLEIANYRNVS